MFRVLFHQTLFAQTVLSIVQISNHQRSIQSNVCEKARTIFDHYSGSSGHGSQSLRQLSKGRLLLRSPAKRSGVHVAIDFVLGRLASVELHDAKQRFLAVTDEHCADFAEGPAAYVPNERDTLLAYQIRQFTVDVFLYRRRRRIFLEFEVEFLRLVVGCRRCRVFFEIEIDLFLAVDQSEWHVFFGRVRHRRHQRLRVVRIDGHLHGRRNVPDHRLSRALVGFVLRQGRNHASSARRDAERQDENSDYETGKVELHDCLLECWPRCPSTSSVIADDFLTRFRPPQPCDVRTSSPCKTST